MAKAFEPTVEEQQELWNRLYASEDGTVRWKQNRGKAKQGCVACKPMPNGYRLVSITLLDKRVRVCAHRLVWFLTTSVWPNLELDHKDEDRGNNRFGNLRLATRPQNTARRKVVKDSNLPRGVVYAGHTNKKNPYMAKCGNTYIGYFSTPEAAGKASEDAHLHMYGKDWHYV